MSSLMATTAPDTWWQYVALFLAVTASWAGVPFIGAAATGAAGVAASQGNLVLAWVIVVTIVAGEVGGVVGYGIGDRWGRQLLQRPGKHQEGRVKLVEKGEAAYAAMGSLGRVRHTFHRLGHGQDALRSVCPLEFHRLVVLRHFRRLERLRSRAGCDRTHVGARRRRAGDRTRDRGRPSVRLGQTSSPTQAETGGVQRRVRGRWCTGRGRVRRLRSRDGSQAPEPWAAPVPVSSWTRSSNSRRHPLGPR